MIKRNTFWFYIISGNSEYIASAHVVYIDVLYIPISGIVIDINNMYGIPKYTYTYMYIYMIQILDILLLILLNIAILIYGLRAIIVYIFIIYKHVYVNWTPRLNSTTGLWSMQFDFVACMSIVLCRCWTVLVIDLLTMIHLHPLILFIIMFDIFGIW